MKIKKTAFARFILVGMFIGACSDIQPTDGAMDDVATIADKSVPPAGSGLAFRVEPIETIPVFEMPFLDNRELVRRDRELRRNIPMGVPVPWQTAEPIHVNLEPSSEGQWETLSGGTRVLRMRISSDGAHSLALGFKRFWMPAGGRLYVYSSDYRHLRGPYDTEDNREHGQLWLPKIPGDEIVIEVQVPADVEPELELELASVNHGYKKYGQNDDDALDTIIYTEDSVDKDGYPICDDFPVDCPGTHACNVDVACVTGDTHPFTDPESLSNFLPEGTEWTLPINAVGQLDIYGGVCGCTGTLVNNTDNDGTPYFMTASHCFRECLRKQTYPGGPTFAESGVTLSDMLASATVYWNYTNSTCRDYLNTGEDAWNPGNLPTMADATVGGVVSLHEWIYGADDKDTNFLQLLGDVDGFDVAFAGWDRSGDLPETVVCVHHPKAQEKRISVDENPFFLGEDIVADHWEIGVAQYGSSGSPLFDEHGKMVGSAASTGNYLNCTSVGVLNDYGRISALWPELAPYLDPAPSTGATVLDAYAPCAEHKSGETVSTGTHTVDACAITAGPAYTVNSGARMTFRADWEIQLKPGFTATPTGSGYFEGRIE